MAIHLEQQQKQSLSPRMIQSVEVLQMSSQQLLEYAKALSMENPVIDFEEAASDDKRQERLKKLEWLDGLDKQNHASYQYDRDEPEPDSVENIGDKETDSFAEVLRQQLLCGPYTPQQFAVFEYIIECLDSQGYYTAPVEELVEHFGISEKEAGACLEIMRNLEPEGACAASLKECLQKQLEKCGEPCDVEIEIVEKYMELLGKNQLSAIAKELQIPLERVQKAREKIRSLNPRPAQGYDNGEPLKYIVPDITIVKFSGHFEILLNDYSYPSFRINQHYLNMMKSDCPPEVKDYLLQKVKQAEQMQECIARRNVTLRELAKCILEAQEDFFLTGNVPLEAFQLNDAAGQMQVHKSTVSRAVKDKYLQCCWGTYPLSFFFNRRTVGADGAELVAAEKIKPQILRLIAEENKKKPYSDQQLAELLMAQNVEISRRTVAKYREQMGIFNGRERKEF